MTGIPLIISFVIAIALMIVSISKWKVHPFLAIMAVSIAFGMVAGIPLNATGQTPGLVDVIGSGFSGTFTSIGLVIIFGAMIGVLLEKTGAALKMADCVVRVVGKKRPALAMLIMGWIVSIPVFCDSGFVILNPIRKALVKRTAASSVATTIALSLGLYISHCFIPPTPGPIAGANTLYQGIGMETNLLLVMGVGAAASVIPLIVGYLYAQFIGKRVRARDEADADDGSTQSYEELVASFGKLPGAWMSFAPIVAPIFLMGFASALSMAGVTIGIFKFLGTPVMSLIVGLLLAVILLGTQRKLGDFHAIADDTLKTVGPILFVTAAGGVLGKVIATTSLVAFIKDNAGFLSSFGMLFPFLIAAILKTAQGSSTVAITTTAGILAPLMNMLGLGTPALAALTVIAIGAGSMTVSHANDSYFWVVTNFGQIDVEDGYKTQTMGTLLIGLASMVGVFLLYFLLK